MRSEFYSLETLCRMHNVSHLPWTAFGNEGTVLVERGGRYIFDVSPVNRLEIILGKLANENNA